MTKRILSVVLALALLFGAVSVATSVVAEDVTTVTYNKSNVDANLTTVENNILKGAVSAGAYYHGGTKLEEKPAGALLGILLDGKVAGDNGSKMIGSQANKDTYFYFVYDLGADYDVTSVLYAGDKTDGADSVSVYVTDLAFSALHGLINATGAEEFAESTAYYDGGIGISSRVTNNKTDAVAVRFNFNKAVSGRYVIFRLEGYPNGLDMFWISEFAAEGTLSKNQTVLYKADQVAAATPSKADNLLSDALYAGTAMNNTACVVDGEYSTTNKATSSGSTADVGVNAKNWYQYDLGVIYDIDKVFYAGDGENGANSVAVYVGNEPLSVIKAGGVAPTATYDYAIATARGLAKNGKSDAAAVAFTFGEQVSGRYVTFCLTTCTNSGTNGAGVAFSYEMNWITEFSATGTVQSGQVKKTLYKKLADANASLTAPNILADAERSAYRQGILGGDGLDPQMVKIVDGKADASTKWCPGGNQYMYFWYDLGWDYEITSVMYAGDGYDGAASVAVYVGNDDLNCLREKGEQDTAFRRMQYNESYIGVHGGGTTGITTNPRVPEDKDRGVVATQFTFTEPQTARYVIFRVECYKNSGNYQCWITELAAAGIRVEKDVYAATYTSPVVPISLADNVLSRADKAYYRESAEGQNVFSEKLTDVLVDGNINSGENKKLCPNSGKENPYIYVVYDMSAACRVDSVYYAGDNTDGASDVAVYVGNDDLDALNEKGIVDSVFADARYDGYVAKVNDRVTADESKGVVAVQIKFAQPKEGRFVIFRLKGYRNPRGTGNHQVWISELSAKGGFIGGLLVNKTPIRGFSIPARGDLNDVSIRTYSSFTDPVGNITNGTTADMGRIQVPMVPEADRQSDYDKNKLNYNTPWLVLEYNLGGTCTLDQISLFSTKEPMYHVAGYKIYAADTYRNLYDEDSLLVTTGGEEYLQDAATGLYYPDPAKDVNAQREYAYTLTAEQAAKTYRYVAVVITRPYGYYQVGTTNRLIGYNVARMSEIAVYGQMVQDESFKNVFTAPINGATATMEIEVKSYDEWAMYKQIGGFEILTSTLDDGVDTIYDYGDRNPVDKKWLTVADNTVYAVRVYDVNGKTLDNSVLANYGIELYIPTKRATENAQCAAILKEGAMHRVVNSYNRPDGTVCIGMIDYPVATSPEYLTNQDKAMLFGTNYQFVMLTYNDLDTIIEQGGAQAFQELNDFEIR